jgi:hypothetical protein
MQGPPTLTPWNGVSRPATPGEPGGAGDGDFDREDAERNAATTVRVARELLQQGKTDLALARLESVLRQYPDTEAAKEAARLFEVLKKGPGGQPIPLTPFTGKN